VEQMPRSCYRNPGMLDVQRHSVAVLMSLQPLKVAKCLVNQLLTRMNGSTRFLLSLVALW
jgi:hypothetical protein